MEEFDCLLVGDDPAGLWFLQKYFTDTNGQRKLAWVTQGNDLSHTPLPTVVARHFGIHFKSSWNAELRFPRETYVWNEKEVTARFPEENLAKVGELFFANPVAAYAIVTRALRRYPELLSIGQAFWRVLGRTSQSRPETQVLSALLSTELCYWDPTLLLSEPIARIQAPKVEQPVEEVKSAKGGTLVCVRGATPILAKHVVLNASLHELGRLFGSELSSKKWFTLDPELKASHASYDFSVTAARHAVPWSLKPLTLVFDESEIPDPDQEIWPLWFETSETQSHLKVSLPFSRQVSLEGVQAEFRVQMKKLNTLFPFLAKSLVSIETPLDTESCYSEMARKLLWDRLESRCRESYSLSSLSFRTANPSVFLLGPFAQCHLAYPLGALTAAREVLVEILRRTKSKSPSLLDASEKASIDPQN